MQKIVHLKDSDNNPITALVEYSPSYVKDCKVVSAFVELSVNGELCRISNHDMILHQYFNDIIEQLEET